MYKRVRAPMCKYCTSTHMSLCVVVATWHAPAVSLTVCFFWNLAGIWHWKSADELSSFTELRSNPQHHSSLSQHTNVGVK